MQNVMSGETILRVALIAMFVIAGVLGITTGYFKARKCQPKGFKWRRFGGEAIMGVVTLVFGYLVLGKGMQWLTAHQWIVFRNEPAAWWVLLLEYAAYFLTFDTWFYWLHRWMHNEPYYKWIHKLHHWSTSPNLLTTISVHPLESLINGGWMIIFVTLYSFVGGVHVGAMAFIAATNQVMGLYVHSGYEFFPKWWNKTWATKWFITATFHDHHHRYFTANFGGYTTIWDRLCGTVHKNFERDFVRIKERPIGQAEPKVEEAAA